MELKLYLQMLQRSWWIVILTALAALAIALAAVFLVQPTFRSTARFVVSPNLEQVGLQDDTDLLRSLEALDRRSIMATYAEVVNSARIFNEAVATLGFTVIEIEEYTHITVVLPDANIMELSVDGPDPAKTTLLANSLGQHAIEYITQLYTVYEVSFMDAASQPTEPISPQPVRDASLAFVLGLVMGAVLAIIREQLRTPLEAFLARTQMDSTSSAYNRRYFEDALDSFTGRSADALVSLGMVRLEGLVSYLQVMPQPIVQQLLRQITDIMRKELRGNDIIGRWDESTFSIMLPNTPGNAAVSTLGRLQSALATPMRFSPDGETVKLSPKVGIGERFTGDGANLVIERAESALDEAEHDENGLVLYKTRALVGF